MRFLFCDIDDTMTTNGLLTRETFDALWDAEEAGLRVVPVTGRPAGWCDHIARQWPVDGVIGENGAFYFRKTKFGIKRVHSQTPSKRVRHRSKLNKIRNQILEEVPGCAVASDQAYREYDLAIDFCEDVKRLSKKNVRKIVEIFESHGAVAKISSIHVNGWFGDFDKLTMTKRYIREVDASSLEEAPEDYSFIGDSPNDEPMFSAFHVSFGVANITKFLDTLRYKPTCIMESEGGAGFAEAVALIISGMKEKKKISETRRRQR
ncbi:MAG: HAD-IIB family hydrolase [Lentisphaerae bacterium]|jgi:HAD superfamily hydrolase (TIGR01484 family)|nr:HAD-IIB family hydrolase [Lentisphaerota bacterium]